MSDEQQQFIAVRLTELLTDYARAFPEGNQEASETIAAMMLFSATGAFVLERQGQTTFERLIKKVRERILLG